MNTRKDIDDTPPCPPNGLARAEWFRRVAAEHEETDPARAAYCRAVATSIEARVLRDRPLLVLMEGGHVTAPNR